MNYLQFLFLCLLLLSCSKVETVRETVTADSLQVIFYVNSSNPADSLNLRKTISSSATISELSNLTKGTNAPLYKCAYTGMIQFYTKDSVSLEMEFNLADACNHVTYMNDSKIISKKIHKDAQSLLIQLETELRQKP